MATENYAFDLWPQQIILANMELNAVIARMISREQYQTVQNRLAQFPTVALIGPQQVGKTTLAKNLSGGRESIYLDLESPSDRNKLADAERYLAGHGQKLVILDEVH